MNFFAQGAMAEYWPDLLVLLAYFGLIIWVGLTRGAKEKTVEGYALGGRAIPWWAVLASIVAAEISAATFLGAPGEGYEKRNWTYAQLVIGTILARIFVSAVFIPRFYKLNVVSIYEFLEHRFSRTTRKASSILFFVTRALAMGTRLYVSAIIVVIAYEAIVLEGLASPQEKFWLYSGAVLLVVILTALYTTIGGIKAVIWTDFIQVGVLVAALGFTIWYLLGRIPGGMETVWGNVRKPVFFDTLSQVPEGKIWWRELLTQEYTIYTAFIASTFVTMATHGIDQDTVQRMLTAKNQRQSAFATIMSGLVDLPVVSAFVFIGILLSTYYGIHHTASLPTESREVFPYFVVHEMPAGLRGLIVAAVMATAMGSLSTALNAMGTSFARDFVLVSKTNAYAESRKLRALRWCTVMAALFVLIVGMATTYYMAHHPEARIIPLVLGVLGYTFGSLLAVFLVGMFTKTRGNTFGNLLGMAMGIVVVILFSIPEAQGFALESLGFNKANMLILAFPWRIVLGTLVTAFVALCFPTPAEKVAETARA